MTGSTSATFASVVIVVLKTLQLLVWVMSGTAVVIFMWGLVMFVAKASDSREHQRGIQLIQWGLIALFIIFSLASILSLLCTSFFGDMCSSSASTGSIST